jgi:Putative DNA-binding domain
MPESITREYVTGLIELKVSERKTIDYKRSLPGAADQDKKEFLADVSSFANTVGGELIFGVTETSGVPTEILGVTATNFDAEKLRLQNMIRDGLQPRLPGPPEMECVVTEDGKSVFVVRILKSWRSPHRVSFGGHGHFYARHSNGKYQLDVGELRDAMIRGESISERIRSFRADRVIAVKAGATPISIEDVPRQIVHLVPLSAFASAGAAEISESIRNIATNRPISLKPLGRPSGWDQRVNLEGRVVFAVTASSEANSRSYTQYYRNGIVEAVGTLPVSRVSRTTSPYVIAPDWVSELREFLVRSFALLEELELSPPILFFFSLTGIRGFTLAMNQYSEAVGNVFEVDDIVLMEYTIESYPASVDSLLSGILKIVWNAIGLEACPLFDDHGNWMLQR